mmetsp:Transcript_136025/g.290804  ORF Transcript_136025/g.290804 Transcript_136025/m.290804 type:complete len:199 (-) Transcript_136025:102-698(-)
MSGLTEYSWRFEGLPPTPLLRSGSVSQRSRGSETSSASSRQRSARSQGARASSSSSQQRWVQSQMHRERLGSGCCPGCDAHEVCSRRPPASWSQTQYYEGARTMPVFREWRRLPAGLSTIEFDQPQVSRFLASNHSHGENQPYIWRSIHGGAYAEGPHAYARDGNFTREAFFSTAQQSHLPNLRQVSRNSPTRIARIV